jgi:hypothetical protein
MKLPCLSYTHWAHQKGNTGYEAALFVIHIQWAHQKGNIGNEAALFIIHTLGSSKRKYRK